MQWLMEGKRWPQPAHEVYMSERNTVSAVEADPTGLVSTQPGAKLDAGKVDVLRGAINYFPRALNLVAKISELGAKKYSWKGWESVPDGVNRYGAALMRHLMHDPYSLDDGPGGIGVLHQGQTAWNALARLELILKELDAKSAQT